MSSTYTVNVKYEINNRVWWIKWLLDGRGYLLHWPANDIPGSSKAVFLVQGRISRLRHVCVDRPLGGPLETTPVYEVTDPLHGEQMIEESKLFDSAETAMAYLRGKYKHLPAVYRSEEYRDGKCL